MIKDMNELFNGFSFNDYLREAETNLPVGMKILESQGEYMKSNEEKIQDWLSCYGLNLVNFPVIDKTNTLVTSQTSEESSFIIYHLPFNGDHKFFSIKPNGYSHKLKCTIDETNASMLIYFPVTTTLTEIEQKAEISEKYKTFIFSLQESMDKLKTDLETFNFKVETAIRTTIQEVIKNSNNNEVLVKELQSEINKIYSV
jgi:hypothetical protein